MAQDKLHKRVLQYLIFAWAAGVAFFFHPESTLAFWHIKEAILGIGAVIIISLWLAYSLYFERITFPRTQLFLPYFALFIWILASFILSPQKSSIFLNFSRICWLFLAVFPLISSLKTGIRRMGRSLLYIGIFGSIYCLFQYWGFDFFQHFGLIFSRNFSLGSFWCLDLDSFQNFSFDPYMVDLDPKSRMLSFFGGKNFTADIMALLFPLAFGEFLLSRKKTEKILPIFFMILATLVILLVQSEGAALGLFCALSFFIFRQWGRRAFLIMTLLLSLGALISGMKVYDRNIELRLFKWRLTLAMICDRPFIGHGPSSYAYLFPIYQSRLFEAVPDYPMVPPNLKAMQAHNEYLNIAADIGILGLCFFLSLYLGLLLKAWQGWERANARKKILISSFGGSLCSLAGISMGGFPLHLPAYSVLCLIIGCILVNLLEKKHTISAHSTLLPKIFCLLVLFWLGAKTVIAEKNAFLGDLAMSRSLEGADLNAILRAIELDPKNGQALFYAGRSMVARGDLLEGAKYLLFSSLYSSDGAIFGTLGGIYHRIGELPKARYYYRKAALMVPGNGLYRLRWAMLEALTGDSHEARKQVFYALAHGINKEAAGQVLRVSTMKEYSLF